MENVTDIRVAYPEVPQLHLRIAVGACRLKVTPGESELWISGSYDDQSRVLPLRIEQEGGSVKITQSFTWPEAWGETKGPAVLTLALGRARPFDLTLDVGANDGAVDLGGVPITRLAVNHGAGKQLLSFSAPNPQPMERLTVAAGATELTLENLANANCAEMSVEGGAAAYFLDFGGALQRDARVKISAGMASVDLKLPVGTAATVNAEAVLGSVDVGGGFTRTEGAYQNEAALAGKTPALTVQARVAMGSIRLHST